MNLEKNDIIRSPAGLRYVVGIVDGEKVYLVRQLGIGRGHEIFEVTKSELEEWKKL